MWFGFRIFLVLITRLVWIFWKGRWFAEERSTVETLRQPSAKGVWRAYRERVASLVNTTTAEGLLGFPESPPSARFIWRRN